jgi:hypothetical protein
LCFHYKHQLVKAVYFENHVKPTHAVYGQNAEFFMVKQVVHTVTTGFTGLTAKFKAAIAILLKTELSRTHCIATICDLHYII